MITDIAKIICGFVYAINTIVNAGPVSKLPKGFIQCKKSDPALDECIKGAVQSGIPHLAKGVPSLNLIKIEPLRIPQAEINQGNGKINLNLILKDIDIINLSAIQIHKTHYEMKNYSLQHEMLAPKPIKWEGDYEISGKVLILPIVGKGRCKMEMEISKIYGETNMKPLDRNGVTYLEVVNITLKLIPTKFRIKMDNLFNGDKALGDNMNIFLNENWRELLNELQPTMENVLAMVFKDMDNQLLSRIPLNQLILD